MDKLKELQKQLEEIEKRLEESRKEDAVAGCGWGCSDRTWELLKKRTKIKNALDKTSNL